MFRRKRTSSTRAPLNPNPSPSAQSAAVQAFRASQAAENVKLSSAAAAAALRRNPTPPTSVGDIRTKRMIQRQLSISSTRSGTGPLPQDSNLRRARSSGSMTTRSFRGPSPSNLGIGSPKSEILPVPPIPKRYGASSQASAPAHRRSASSQAPMRVTSPPQIMELTNVVGLLRDYMEKLVPWTEDVTKALSKLEGAPLSATRAE